MASGTVTDQRGHLRARTLRRDAWWLTPLVTLLVLLGFVAYGIWVAFVDRNYFADPYISPFYSPCLAAKCGDHATAAIFGTWWPLAPDLGPERQSRALRLGEPGIRRPHRPVRAAGRHRCHPRSEVAVDVRVREPLLRRRRRRRRRGRPARRH